MKESGFLVDTAGSRSTAMEVPPFPWVRAEAGLFIWEEALHQGNLCSVHHSAAGRCQSRENVWRKLTRRIFPNEHAASFELEIDGQLLRDRWRWAGTRVTRTPEGWERLAVELACDRPPVSVRVLTQLDGSSFVVRWLEIANDGPAPIRVSRVFPWAGIIGAEEEGLTISTLDDRALYSLGRFLNQRWGMEGEFAWGDLPDGTFSETTLGNRHAPPFFVVRNARTGEMTVLHVECTHPTTVSFTQAVERTFNLPGRPWGGRYLAAKAGLGGRPPARVLAPGESAVTPMVHVSMIQGDLDECVTRLHDHLRASVMPRPPEGRQDLVEYNHTGYTLNAQVSAGLLREEVDMAAEIGVELFLVDAGWFGPRETSWDRSVGDWRESPTLGEGGLREVFAYARGKGMKCGLWMPPEWVSPGTPVHTDHPDWFLPGTTTFDLLNPAVEQFVFDTICGAVERYRLDCFRIDGGSSDAGQRALGDGTIEDVSWRYYEKLYGLYERVRARYPSLVLENCSGGGGRSDLAMMRRFDYTQVTDNWDPACQVRILNGMTLALPPRQCMPLVGAINMRAADVDFVIRTGLFGHFTASGVFPSLRRTNAPALSRWKHAVRLYKEEMRPLLPDCRVYHHTPLQEFRRDGEWVVLEYAAPDRDKAIVGLFRLPGSANDTFHFVARGLDPSRDYRLAADSGGTSRIFSGGALCDTGIDVRVAAPLMSELLIVKRA